MKKILLLILLLPYISAFAQFGDGDPYYFCTLSGEQYNPGKHGSSNEIDDKWVVTIDSKDYTRYEKTFIQERYLDDYSNHTIIGEATPTYNCHGYSFGISQGTIPCKITWFKEICDGSFVEITDINNLNYGDIAVVRKYTDYTHTILDNESEHSSIVVNQDTLISKWGNGPLTKHHKHDVVNMDGIAMGSSVYTYYRRIANTQIDGPDVFVGNATYTFTPNVIPYSCSWSVEPAEMFSQSSGSGNIANLSYKSTLSYLAPKAILTFTFAYTCDNYYTVKKEIDLTIPTTTLSGMIVSDGFVINEGATVMLTGEVRNNDNAKTVIKPGGSLVINGGVMTNSASDKKWQGIQVWGNDSEHQYIINGKRQQGYLELKNGATIENAICAVELWNPSNYSSEGGVVYATDAVFRNNAKAVHAINYTNFNPGNGNEMPYDSHFRNCTFTIDRNYIGDELFYKHVDLDRVRGIVFSGCLFSVDRNVPQVTPWTSGIAAYNAGFMVDSYCDSNYLPCPEDDLVRTTFTGFTYGVLSSNDGSVVRTFIVRNSKFNNNEKGIYVENAGYATIVGNEFNVGSKSDCSFGVYINGAVEFCIEENNFYGNARPNNDTYGILVSNSGAYNNNIYKNHFHNLTCGNLSMGNNGKSIVASSSKQKGLVYLCNTNESNINDFCVIRDETAIANGIAGYQGSYLEAAGNTFSASQYQFYNAGDDIINYCYYNNDSLQQPANLKWYRVLTIATSNPNLCISHYGGGNNTITRTAEEINELQSEYKISLNAFTELNNLYTSRIDGGNTQAEVLDINTATANDAMRLRSELLGLSPYLSNEVLTTAAQREDVFSSSVLFEILSANPDELKKDTLISYLENKNNPMPQYMTELLREMANGTTARTALESQMAKSEREYLLAAGDIVRSNLNGEESDNEELRTWLANMNDMASDRLIVASYIQEGDFANALALAEILPYVYNLKGAELIEHNDYMTLVRLYETLYESGRSIIELTEEETLMVEEIVENGNGNSQTMAYSILAQNDETMTLRATCPTLPSVSNSSRGRVNIQTNIADAMGVNVNLAPNPASAWSEVEYTLPADYSKAELVITNALGINVIKEELRGSCGRMTLNLERLPSGVYTYFVRCGEYVKTGKLIKK